MQSLWLGNILYDDGSISRCLDLEDGFISETEGIATVSGGNPWQCCRVKPYNYQMQRKRKSARALNQHRLWAFLDFSILCSERLVGPTISCFFQLHVGWSSSGHSFALFYLCKSGPCLTYYYGFFFFQKQLIDLISFTLVASIPSELFNIIIFNKHRDI